MDRVKVPGLIALALAALALWRTRSAWWRAGAIAPRTRALLLLVAAGVIGWLWWIGVSIETQMGFSGNDRYLVLGTALIAIAGGVGWGWGAAALAGWLRRTDLGGWLRRRLSAAASAATATGVALVIGIAVPPSIGSAIINVPATHRALVYQAHLRADIQTAINSLGGAKRVLACGTVMTEGFQVPMVAWYLDVKILRVQAPPNPTKLPGGQIQYAGPPWPDVIFQSRDTRHARLLPLPAQILAWERDGARYAFHHFRGVYVFDDCGAKVSS
jgi:hypothetical protein